MSDVQIFIHKFDTKWVPDKKNPGTMKPRDYVLYSPLGSAQKTVVVAYIEELQPMPIDGDLRAMQNPVVQAAHAKWAIIEPRYKAWKEGRTVTVDGTPLAAWPHVTQELADLLRLKGVQTVEQLSKLTDVHRQSLGIQGLGDLIENAKRFVLALDKTQVTSALEKKDAEIAELQAKMAELVDMVKEAQEQPRRGPGRPRKEPEDAQQVA